MVLIKSFEGFRPRAVQTPDGAWVIGYGHTASAREGATVGERDAELLLQYDLLPVVKALNDDVSVPLNQHQFDALASFAVSVGVDRFLGSDVLGRLNAGRAGEAADALIGWPEATAADAALRRRAAERALFVADPGSPVLLADLLAAPLPPPPVQTAGPEVPAADPAAVRAAAVASLLGEEPAPAQEAAPIDAPVDAAAPQTDPQPVVAAEAPRPSVTFAPPAGMRYSPYSASIVGPLPGFPSASPQTPAQPAIQPAAPEAEAPPPTAPEPARVQPDPFPPVAPVSVPVAPLVPAAPAPSPFPPMEELVLTPPDDADFAEIVRPVWTPEQRPAAAEGGEDSVLFDDEPTLSVLRHEIEPEQPQRFDWSETGAFLIMGGVGLAACAASAAAFRLAVTQPSDMGETTVIAWALAVIGAICVSVSSWNLYVRWGRKS